MKTTLILLSGFLAGYQSVGAQQVTPARDKKIDAYINAQMIETATTGMAVAVVKNGKTLHQASYGMANIEHNIPVTANTNFAIASTTKLMTSTLIMKWAQQGKISMEDLVIKYISSAPNWKNINIGHLLAHEGGIPWPSTLGGYLGIGSAVNFQVEPIESVIVKLKDSALVFAPGSKQAYQNGDYFALQYIIEKIGGAPIETVLKNEVLLPLGMSDGGYDIEYRGFPFQTMYPVKNKSQNFTAGIHGPLVFKGFYAPSSYGAGGMYLSISDLVAWAMALDSQIMIRKETLKKALTPSANAGGFSAMGWAIQKNNGVEIAGHSGGPGLADVLRVPKDNFTVIVLTNNSDLYAYMAQEILQFYYPQVEPEKMPKSFKRNLVR